MRKGFQRDMIFAPCRSTHAQEAGDGGFRSDRSGCFSTHRWGFDMKRFTLHALAAAGAMFAMAYAGTAPGDAPFLMK
jgi:hypothetical protein